MNRSVWITGVIVAQALWAIFFIVMAVIWVILASPSTSELDLPVLKIAVAWGIPALLASVSVYGLRKGMLWGWWLAFFTDFGLLAVLVYNTVDGGIQFDWATAAMTMSLAIVPVFLLIPVVRKFFWRSTPKQAAEL